MNEEEKKAIEDMDRFANGIDMSGVSASQMKTILNLIEKFKNFIHILDDELKERNKTINEKEILIEKLQKENERLKKQVEYDKTHIYTPRTIELNYVSKQKIKDKIEEYKNMLKTCNKAKDIDRIKAINERILELEELLEGRK